MNNNKKNDLSVLKLNGKIKSLYETTYWALDKNGEIQKRFEEFKSNGKINFKKEVPINSRKHYEFNKKGNITNESGNPYGSISYSYDEYGNKIRKIEDCSHSDFMEIWFTNYIFDDKNNIVEESISENYYNGLYQKIIFKYDSNGKKIEENNYDRIALNSNDFLFYKKIFKYADNGRIIEEENYDRDGGFKSKVICWYNHEGNLVEKIDYINEEFQKETYNYDDKGYLIEKTCYNSKDNLILQYIYMYVFDENHNWIKRTEFKNDIPEFITERDFFFYD